MSDPLFVMCQEQERRRQTMTDIKTDAIEKCIDIVRNPLGYPDGRDLSDALWPNAESELAAILQRLEAQDKQLAVMRGAVQATLSNNGGPIDAEDTVDGIAYVMVRTEDFGALESALTPDDGKCVVDVEDINRLFEVIEARFISNPEIVVIEMLDFARKYIPEHPNAQANTLREKVLADSKLRYRVVDVAWLKEIQWAAGYTDALGRSWSDGACPDCRGRCGNHTPGCKLATLIGEGE